MIRAGYLIDNQGYQSGTPDTYMSGWGYEYLQDISYHTEGWKYEYVLGTFSELIAKHEAREIDLMSSISYTPERAENLLYSTNPSGKKCYYVYVKPARGDLTVGDPEALRGKTIGVNPDVLQTTEGKAWLAERGIDVTYKEYATGGEVFSALSSGEVDAIIMNDVLSSDDAMPVIYVGESDYYFTVPKSRPDIMAELDAAMAQILTSNLHYNDEFKARYSAINVGSSSLTDRERDRLASCDNTVTVGYLDNLRPYSLRGKDNQMEGALSAVVSDMRERFGITVNERAYSSNSDSEAALGRGEIDVALPFAKDYWIAEQEGYAQSDSLASSSLVALYKGDDLGSALSSILVQPNSIVSESLLRSRYPDADIIMCDNASACFDALSSGRAQAAIIPVMALDVVRSQNDLSAYKTAELPGTVRLTARMRQDAPTAYYADFATPFHVPLLHRSAVGRYVPMRQPLDQRGARERPSWRNRPATDLADALAHGLIALDVDYIRAINDAINNRIGYCALAELGMPAGWRELRAYQQGACAQPALDDLEELSRALPADLFQKPIVQDEQVALEVSLLCLEPFLVFLHRQLVEHLGEPHVPHGEEGVACGDPERARDPAFARARRPGQQNVPVVAYPFAVREFRNPHLVQLAVGVVMDVCDVRLGLGEARLPEQPRALVHAPRVPFRVDYHGDPLVEGHVGGARHLL